MAQYSILDKRIIHLQGQRFGRLVVIEFSNLDPNRGAFWLCRCDCGKTKAIRGTSLRQGVSKSCGCRGGKWRHGKCESRVYKVWNNMVGRCYCPSTRRFDRYGGRGISVCDRWRDFLNFYADMGDPPDGLTLNRIDNDGNYEPGNCRWATWSQQMLNTSQNELTHKGITLTVKQWANRIGVKYKTLHRRLHHYHWSVERALDTPPGENTKRANISVT